MRSKKGGIYLFVLGKFLGFALVFVGGVTKGWLRNPGWLGSGLFILFNDFIFYYSWFYEGEAFRARGWVRKGFFEAFMRRRGGGYPVRTWLYLPRGVYSGLFLYFLLPSRSAGRESLRVPLPLGLGT